MNMLLIKKVFTSTVFTSFLCLLMMSCSSMQPTPYVAATQFGKEGYSHKKISDDQYRVLFTGNRQSNSASVRDFALLHAADLTLELGYDWFVIADSESAVETKTRPALDTNQFHSRPTSTSCGLLTCTTTQSDTHTSHVTHSLEMKDKVLSSLLITMGHGKAPSAEKSFNAQALLKTLATTG